MINFDFNYLENELKMNKKDLQELKQMTKDYREECKEIAIKCEEEGYPTYGSNYELRIISHYEQWYKHNIDYIFSKYDIEEENKEMENYVY